MHATRFRPARVVTSFPRRGALAGGALTAGALAACGFQPLALWPLTIVAIALWIELLARARSGGQAFLIGWLFGLAHFTLGNNWIATAFTYQAEMPQWLGGIAVFLLSLYLAVFPALAALAAWLFCERLCGKTVRENGAVPENGTARLLIGLPLIGAWIVTEWMRAWLFTGFAWNPLGVALLGSYDSQGFAVLARWIGTYGLSGFVVALAAVLHLLVRGIWRGTTVRRVLSGLVMLALGAPLVWFMTTPASYLIREEGEQPFTLVQPDFRQETLNRPELFESQFARLARLSTPKRAAERRMVFWPESGLPDYLREGYPFYLYRAMTYAADPAVARERIGNVIGPYSILLTGAVDIVIEDGDDVAARNSVTAIDYRGHILAGYSKAHLVPYGEYLPMRGLLEPIGLSRLVAGTLDFWPGPGPRTFDFGTWGEAGIQICYEIVFSGEVVDPANRPDYIFNPSNDGWFGDWGPPQHLAQARLRAIEEGLPVLRSTTTGISAVIDADGIVRAFIPPHQAGRIDGRIPPANEPTAFSRHGNTLPLLLAGLVFLVSLVAIRLLRR